MKKTAVRALLPAVLLAAAAGCGTEGAWGDANSIIVGAEPGLWEEVEDTVYAALERRVRAVREEKTFRLTWQDPREERWGHLRRFRQLVVVGGADDPWVAPVLEEVEGEVPEPPAIVQTSDVWARGQGVTVLLLSPGGGAPEVREMLGPLHELLERQFRGYARSRMFLSGRDSALADTLARTAGFSLLLPEVYQWERRDSVYKFRNDNPDPSELIREIVVTWRTPIPDDSLAAREVLEWRQSLVEEHYGYPQVLDTGSVEVHRGEVDGRPYREVRAVWTNPPGDDFPAAGPFRTRVVRCPSGDRLYLVDAWLYAPGRDKWEYLIQLETILDSFRCGGERGGGVDAGGASGG